LGGNKQKFDYIACGGLHTLGIRNGKVYSWGRGEGGQLGQPVKSLKQKKKE
jgi:alpha-tubulin suppressor-like RCC1 family protein